MYHCAESLATNYWLDFIKSDAFKNLDKQNPKQGKGKISAGGIKVDLSKASSLFVETFDLKKEMKKGGVPAYIQDSALFFFNHECASLKSVKIKDSEQFQEVFQTIPLFANFSGFFQRAQMN